MKFMVKAAIPTEAGNALVRDPNMQSSMESVMGDIRPETTYFTIDNGKRTVYFIVNIDTAEDMPRIAEPLWLSWGADVTVLPVFVPEEMEGTMDVMAEIVKKYPG